MGASPQPSPGNGSFLTQILQKLLSQQSSGPGGPAPVSPLAPQQQGPQPGALPQDPVAQFKQAMTQQAQQGQQATQQAHQQGILKGLMAGITARQPAPDPKKSQQTITDTAAPLLKLFGTLMGKV